MRWAAEHGSDDPKVAKTLTYFWLLKELHLKPDEVDRMDNILIEEFLIVLKKVLEMKGGESVLEFG